MTIFKFKNQQQAKTAQGWLAARNKENIITTALNNDPNFYVFYCMGTEEDTIHYLPAFEELPPEATHCYSLTEDQHIAFLEKTRNDAEIIFNTTQQHAIEEGKRDFENTLSTITAATIKEQASQATRKRDQTVPPALSSEEINEVAIALAQGAAELQLPESFQEKNAAGLSGVTDAAWMLQSVATNTALISSHGQTAAQLASIQSIGGILFGIGTGLLMGIGCGLASKEAYYKNAVSEFKTKHGVEPNDSEKKLIERDAKQLGYMVFGSMTGWSIAAGLMQGIFYVVKTAVGLTPHGVIINVAISIAAGIGDAMVSAIAFYQTEKLKYQNADGTLDKEKWDTARKSPDFVINIAKTAIISFVSGFAWNMIGAYLPAPIQSAIKNTGGKVLSVVATAAASGLASFVTFCAGIGVSNLFKRSAKVKDSPQAAHFSSVLGYDTKNKPTSPPSDNASNPVSPKN